MSEGKVDAVWVGSSKNCDIYELRAHKNLKFFGKIWVPKVFQGDEVVLQLKPGA